MRWVSAFVPSPIPFVLARQRLSQRAPQHDRALVRIHPGVYAPRDVWLELKPWDRYLARVHAVQLTWRDPLFCLESAASLLGLPVFGEPHHVHVLARGRKTLTRGRIAAHAFQDRRDLISDAGMSATSAADTVLDLGRVLPPAFGLAVADAAVRADCLGDSVTRLRRRAMAQAARRGQRQLDWILASADGASESVHESVSRAVIDWLGYERPELQTWFHYEGAHDRADFYWRSARVIGEADGYGKYGSADSGGSTSRLSAEKTREDRLRRHERGFVRWEWRDALHPYRLDAKLRAGGLVPLHAPNAALLATLADNSRSEMRSSR
jgi:hypothetical protein